MTEKRFVSNALALATATALWGSLLTVGGCDGLSTVVPFADDAYPAARSSTRIEASEVLTLDEFRGLHPKLEGLHRVVPLHAADVGNGEAQVIGRIDGGNLDDTQLRTRVFGLTGAQEHACRTAVLQSFVWNQYCTQLLP